MTFKAVHERLCKVESGYRFEVRFVKDWAHGPQHYGPFFVAEIEIWHEKTKTIRCFFGRHKVMRIAIAEVLENFEEEWFRLGDKYGEE